MEVKGLTVVDKPSYSAGGGHCVGTVAITCSIFTFRKCTVAVFGDLSSLCRGHCYSCFELFACVLFSLSENNPRVISDWLGCGPGTSCMLGQNGKPLRPIHATAYGHVYGRVVIYTKGVYRLNCNEIFQVLISSEFLRVNIPVKLD